MQVSIPKKHKRQLLWKGPLVPTKKQEGGTSITIVGDHSVVIQQKKPLDAVLPELSPDSPERSLKSLTSWTPPHTWSKQTREVVEGKRDILVSRYTQEITPAVQDTDKGTPNAFTMGAQGIESYDPAFDSGDPPLVLSSEMLESVDIEVGMAFDDLPEAAIYAPEVVPFERLIGHSQMTAMERAYLDYLMQSHDYYVVNFACMFNPKSSTHVTSAQFQVRLRGKTGEDIIAHDMFPPAVVSEKEYDIALNLTPSVVIQGVTVSGIGLQISTKKVKLIPLITPYGKRGSRIWWTYSNQDIKGDQEMHILMEGPKGASPISAELYLKAQIQIDGLWGHIETTPPVTKGISVQLWPE